MNILQVLPELNAGGVERTTIEIAQALSAAGHVPHVACMGGRMEDELRAAGGALHRLPVGSKNPLTLRSNTRALIKLIKAHNIDLVHARSRAPAWPAKAAAQTTNIPFITTYHGIYNAKSRIKRRYNAVMTKGDLIIANSKFTKNHIIEEHGTDPEKIIVIPRGVDMDLFDPAKVSTSDMDAVRTSWGVDGSRSVLLLPGRLTRWKGQLVAVRALAKLQDNGIDADLVLLGDPQGRDEYVAEIKALCTELGLAGKVKIAAHTNYMPGAYAASDLVISASTDPEAFGRVAAEAQAMHKLVMASDHGGAQETVINGETGSLTKPGDVAALAAAITAALARPKGDLLRMGKAARARISHKFSDTALKTATLAVYARALESGGK